MKKRGKQRQNTIKSNPVELAMRNGKTVYEKNLDRLRATELAAIDAFASIHAREQEWHEINAMVGICRLTAKAGIGIESIAACDKAEQHLREDFERFKATGRMGTTGPGLQAYRDVFAYMDLQRQSITEAQYADFIQKTIKQVTFTQR